MNKIICGLVLLILFQLPIQTHAGIINQQGSLQYNSDSHSITDLSTGRIYTSFDTFNLRYDEVIAAIAPNGSLAGWKLADTTIADEFINAILPAPSSCSGSSDFRAVCGNLLGWNDDKFGEIFDTTFDYFMFLSTDESIGRPEFDLGFVGISSEGQVVKGDDWNTLAVGDSFINHPNNPANYLLYRDIQQVPEISSIAIMSLGLFGLLGFKPKLIS